MRIEMKTTLAGPDGTIAAGTIVDMDRKKAKALIDGHFAVAVDDEGTPKLGGKDKGKGKGKDAGQADLLDGGDQAPETEGKGAE